MIPLNFMAQSERADGCVDNFLTWFVEVRKVFSSQSGPARGAFIQSCVAQERDKHVSRDAA